MRHGGEPDQLAGTLSGNDGRRWRALLDLVGEIVLVHDETGTIWMANKAARALYPEVTERPGLQLAELVPELADAGESVSSVVRGRRLEWRRRVLDTGYWAWVARETPLLGPGVSLLSAGNPGLASTARSVAELAAPALADCCVVVLPATRGRFTWWRRTGTGAVEQGRIGSATARAIPGLAELLAGQHPAGQYLASACLTDAWPCPPELGEVRDVVLSAFGPDGALILLNGANGSRRTVDLDLLTEFTGHAEAAVRIAARVTELSETTAGLESSLLPEPLPQLPGVRFAAAYLPAQAGLRVGGDFYDVHTQADGTAVFALGDACGHGPEAASLAGHVRSCLGALRLVEDTPSALLALLNQAIRTTSGSRFTTAVLGRLTAADGAVDLELGSGGHPAPLVVRANGQVEDVIIRGGLLGVFPDSTFDQVRLRLGPGEICLLYTDGLTEARRADGEQFGTDRLRETLQRLMPRPLDQLVHDLCAEAATWLGGPLHDDTTLLAIEAA